MDTNTQLQGRQETYDEGFYARQMDGSYRSAVHYVNEVFSFYSPRSVIDVGCGRGMWLKAFKERGVSLTVGLDGPWNSQANMIDSSIEFRAVNLSAPLSSVDSRTFDLALSLEVAEHLDKSSAETFVDTLVHLSDIVLFGAAYTAQGGTHHVNEQPHTHWARLFRNKGFEVFDLFRPIFWGHSEIEFWYQQNTFLYVRAGHPLIASLANRHVLPVKNLAFLDCVHPTLYQAKLDQATALGTLKRMILSAIPRTLHPGLVRLKNFLRSDKHPSTH